MRRILNRRAKKKSIFFICIFLVVFSAIILIFSSCSKDIYNDDKKIAEQGDSYSYGDKIGSQKSNNDLDLKFSGFSGYDTILILKVSEDSTITLNYDLNIKSGNFKLVKVSPDKHIENILEESATGNKNIELKKGEYRFKIVGKSSKGQIKISFNDTKNIEAIISD